MLQRDFGKQQSCCSRGDTKAHEDRKKDLGCVFFAVKFIAKCNDITQSTGLVDREAGD